MCSPELLPADEQHSIITVIGPSSPANGGPGKKCHSLNGLALEQLTSSSREVTGVGVTHNVY